MVRIHRRRRGVLLGIGLYALVVLGSPLLHHDVARHFKSASHCTACTSTPIASSEVHGVVLDAARLPEAGLARIPEVASVPAAPQLTTPGRSPPR